MHYQLPTSFLAFYLLISMSPVWAERTNQLDNHPSPYLAMHGQDPVLWQTWGKTAQEAAVRENKLLFVSSGYFSCHWCHVMQRESYANPEIAKLLNEYFIPVKVDRELNPALDARLIDFVERTRGYAGWPLNVFITPEGYPLVGMVYLPPENFKSLLARLSDQWTTNQAELKELAVEAAAELTAGQLHQVGPLSLDAGSRFAKLFVVQSFELADDLQGGFGEQNKFPTVPQLQVLLNEYKRTKSDQLASFIHLTLEQMASQGLNDQLGGGFFRYTVDPAWQTPHFEKMLYDNAQLTSLYLQAASVFQREDYQQVARRTLSFILDEMVTPDGAFAASLSAVDNKGIEGGYYLWHLDELTGLLTREELQVARAIWGLQGKPELEAGHHLVQRQDIETVAAQLKLPVSIVQMRLDSARQKMLRIRQQRKIPIDTKQIAAWNGLTLSALAKAVQVFDDSRYRTAGQELRDYIATVLWNDQQLKRAVSGTGDMGQAGLEDYAYVAAGFLDWANVSNNPEDIKLAREITLQAWERFHQQQEWLLAENIWLRYGEQESLLTDSVMPSPSAVLIKVSLYLASKTNDKKLAVKAQRALHVGETEISEAPFWYATQIDVLREHQLTKM